MLADLPSPSSLATFTLICIDRSIKPVYPDWVKEILHPELENTGPEEYDVATLEQWLHDEQKMGPVGGEVIYNHLKDKKMLPSCLGLRDGEELAKHPELFRKLFGRKAVFLWKSVVRRHGGSLSVPYVVDDGDGVLVDWGWLECDWRSHSPALRRASRS